MAYKFVEVGEFFCNFACKKAYIFYLIFLVVWGNIAKKSLGGYFFCPAPM